MNEMDYFEKHGCVFVKNFIDESLVDLIRDYFQNKIFRGEWTEGIEGGMNSSRYFYYADPLIEVMLLKSKEAVEDIVGKKLIPTYSYSRIYQPGESLLKHVDRSSCEITVTANIVTVGKFSPIYTQYGQNNPQKHILDSGDAVVYKGCDVTHWRDTLEEGQMNVQIMLHYVDKNGPHINFAKDGRPNYGYYTARRQ